MFFGSVLAFARLPFVSGDELLTDPSIEHAVAKTRPPDDRIVSDSSPDDRVAGDSSPDNRVVCAGAPNDGVARFRAPDDCVADVHHCHDRCAPNDRVICVSAPDDRRAAKKGLRSSTCFPFTECPDSKTIFWLEKREASW